MISLEEMSMLTTLYTQPHRKYHDIYHINDCLTELEQFSSADFTYGDRQIVEAAIWYHDAVYNPYSKHNEVQSASLLRHPLENIASEAQISKAILATAKHLQTQTDIPLTTQVMLDIDLSGFGKPWPFCKRNGDNIRAEYYNSTDLEFYQGRLKFIETIRKRESLYYTDYFKDKYHAQSQQNLITELQVTVAALDMLTHSK